MTRTIAAAATVALLAGLAGGWWTHDLAVKTTNSPEQLDDAITRHIKAHPEEIVDANIQYRADQHRQHIAEINAKVRAHHSEIFDDSSAPWIGDEHGDVTLVEFFDFRCPYCKALAPLIDQLIKSDPHLRIVFHEMPILKGDSLDLSHLAVATIPTGRYRDFYMKVFTDLPPVSQHPDLGAFLQTAGFDYDALRPISQSEATTARVQHDLDLALAVGAEGTPTWFINDHIIDADGKTPLDQLLRNEIANARRAAAARSTLSAEHS
jgi:protein-disulfide isomerase